MNNRLRWLFAVAVLLIVLFPQGSRGAQTATVVPKVKFTRAFDFSKPIYIEVSIENGPSTMITLTPNVRKGNFTLEGVTPGRNYIIKARASNDPTFPAGQTQSLMAFVRKDEMLLATATVNINSQTTPLAEAVLLYCENTGRDLNDPIIEADLDAIEATTLDADPGTDPLARAIELSTTSVAGTVRNINDVAVGGATVATVGVVHSAASTTDASGNFTLLKVPLRCTRLEATCAPRYLPAQSNELTLQQSTPLSGVLIQLRPDPAAARIDIRAAANLMVDNSSGKLPDYLTVDPAFTYTFPDSAGTGTLTDNRADFIATVPGTYYTISWTDADYSQAQSIDGLTVHFTVAAWTTRDKGTYRRTSYSAVGDAVFEGALWRLKSLTLAGRMLLPAPPALQATSGDGSVALQWTASSDGLVTGYYLYRTNTNIAPAETATPIKTLGKAETAFVDSDLPTGTYYYWIRSIENYDPGTGALSVAGPLSSGIQAAVFSSRTVVEQFMQCALNRDQTGMAALLGDSFQGYLPGSSYGMTKAGFITWMLDVFSLDTTQPARLWRVDSAVKDGAWLKVRALQIGHRVETDIPRNSRLIEEESWQVQNTTGSTPIITRLVLAAPKYYPLPPQNMRCTNQDTVESDAHVDLAWDKPADPELRGYRILRSETQDYDSATAKWLQRDVASELAPDQTTFTDSISVTGKTYFYWVIAYDKYDVNTMTEPNKNNCVQVGLPAEVKAAAQLFLDSTINYNATGVRSAVAAGFQASQVSRVFTLDAYCATLSSTPPTMNLESYQFLWAVQSVVDGVETVRVTYSCTGTWDQLTISRAEIEVIKVNNVWKVKTATFVDVTG